MSLPALHPNVLRCIIRLVPFVFALTGILGRSEEAADEFTRAVASYELTLPALEAYGATMTGVADWTVANPAKAAKMNKRTPKGPTSFRQSIAHVETEPVIAEQLKKNKLDGRDFVLIPMVVMQARIAALGEAQGHTFPADRINPKNTALVRANEKRVGEIMTKVAADRVRAFGQ